MTKNKNWQTISIPIELVKHVEAYINSTAGRKAGYTSKTGFIIDSIKHRLPAIIPDYEQAFHILMEHFDTIPEELRNDVDERLQEVGC